LLTHELGLEVDLLGEGGDHVLGIVDGDRGVGLDEVGGHFARPGGREAHGLGFVAVEADDQPLDVENDVGDVLVHAGHGGELVLHALDAHAGHRGALDAREERAAQAVAHGHAEAAFKRFDHEAREGVALRSFIRLHAGRQFQSSPTNMHDRLRRSAGPEGNSGNRPVLGWIDLC
jgi:hypothetical protein